MHEADARDDPAERRFVARYELTVADNMSIAFGHPNIVPFGLYAAFVTGCALVLALFDGWPALQAGDVRGAALVLFTTIVGAGIGAAITIVPVRAFAKIATRWQIRQNMLADSEVESIAAPDGLTIVWRGQRNHCPWNSFVAVEDDGKAFYFWITESTAYLWPTRTFSDPSERASMRESLDRWTGNAVSPPRLARMGGWRRKRLQGRTRREAMRMKESTAKERKT